MQFEKLEKKKGEHGGKRNGSGRKAKEKIYSELSLTEKRKRFLEFISEDDFQVIVKNYIDQAKKSPNQAEYIINQMIGKPMQAMEVTGRNGQPLLPINKAVEILKIFTSNG